MGDGSRGGDLADGSRVGAAKCAPPSLRASYAYIATLTEREEEVFQLVGMGKDNRAIAKRLSISERTARVHLTRIMSKLRLRSRLQVGIVAACAFCWCQDVAVPAGAGGCRGLSCASQELDTAGA
ncbi:LuxR family transcriptional regulator [Streptomyces sp. AJS327]|uniref:helix-turn-helix domain-containing protein n=1 Tax=Streptomyces sp. AJS327 TaxID=2545265 RepID=UPI0015DD58E1|nr:helix-turn-helix transcriptional regulator [Streptomyces sp. AJS327]MBA0050953.1 LuxR family transcriptional regulator [Streptomyces sp. AJS327]